MKHEPESTLLEFARYNQWANQLLLTVCESLSEDQLAAPIPGAYGTIRATFRHMLRAEADYIGRITGAKPEPPFNWDDAPSLQAQHAYAGQLGQAFSDVVERVPPTQIVREEENGQWIEYHARQLFMQHVIHGIEHRINISTYLNTLGVTLPEMDNWGYLFTHGDRFALREGRVGG